MEMKVIAHIYNAYEEKFGIPRQSGRVQQVVSRIVMEKEYRNEHAFRGIEEYSYLWLIWQFSENVREDWSPTVRPPRLGGNERMGVFATRSSFRPNAMGLSSVKLEKLEIEEEGPVLYVTGADLMNGTPIFDIKPYLPYTDSHAEAMGGFADRVYSHSLSVEFPKESKELLSKEQISALTEILSQDPRPSYQMDENRIYGMKFDGWNIKFRVSNHHLMVCEMEEESNGCKEE